jgi:hypothetical protein
MHRERLPLPAAARLGERRVRLPLPAEELARRAAQVQRDSSAQPLAADRPDSPAHLTLRVEEEAAQLDAVEQSLQSTR